MVEEILNKKFYKNSLDGFYLTTGRTLAHYNNAAQTKRSKTLLTKYDEDVILASVEDREIILSDRVILKSPYGETANLPIKFSDKIKPRTLFVTFHHSKSKINALFGDEADELIDTARFKSVKVEVVI
jgi:formate dehydrogenase major subunit